MATQNETTINIQTRMDSKAAEATERLAKATKSAAEEEDRLHKSLEARSGLGGSALGGRLSQSAGRFVGSHLGAGRLSGLLGGQLAGGLGGAAIGIGVGIAGYAALATAASKTADALNVLQNRSLTAAQKTESLIKMIPGAESFLKFRDALNGVTESLRRMNEDQQIKVLQQSNLQEQRIRTTEARAELGRYQFRGQAFAGVKVPDELVKLARQRNTFAGEIAFQEEATRFPAKANLGRAEAERVAAQREMEDSQRVMGHLTARRAELFKRAEKATAEEKAAHAAANQPGANAGDAKVAITEAGLKAMLAQQAVLNNEAQIETEINRQKQLGVALTQKESEVRKAQIGLAKAEMQILQQKEQRMAGTASALGAMNPAQRAMAVRAVEMAQKVGDVGLLPPQLRGLAQQVAPGLIGKLTEEAGLKAKEFGKLQDLGAVDKGNLAQVREELAKATVKNEVQINLDEQKTAEAIADRLAKSLADLIATIHVKADERLNQLATGLRVKNAQQ